MRVLPAAVAASAALAVMTASVRLAEACGCLSPPAVTEGDYAVNQQAEQLIFEVEDGWVTAHVLIKYAGAPEQFAWIIPVPEVPELGLSPTAAFALLDRATAPRVSVQLQDLCPISRYQCAYHPAPDCDGSGGDDDSPTWVDGGFGVSDAAAPGGEPPPVTVIDTQTVGDYQTVTFTAAEATAALDWLDANGFIVNPTMAPYMQPYVDDGMVFVAAKLVPGASTATAIRPLRLRYRGPWPMIPLVLTAVAAEPHLTINAFVYSDQPYRPVGRPVVTIDPRRIALDGAGRLNYPMVLARTIDEAGGQAFVVEYAGAAARPDVTPPGGCCDAGGDLCGLGGNDQCECPRADFDRRDCEATQPDLLAGIALLDGMAGRHTTLTRLTTRLSPEEMTFDPQFEPGPAPGPFGPLTIARAQPSLAGCEADVVDGARLRELTRGQACAATYCGRGTCAATAQGGACQCEPEHVAYRFVDADGAPSVTCVPALPPVDFEAGGRVLPDACRGVSCGQGTCVDRNGVATCLCAAGAAAIPGAGAAPRCVAILSSTGDPGAIDRSEPLRDLSVCAPAPPTCDEGGWLVDVGSPRPGLDCPSSRPSPAQLEMPDEPRCGTGFFAGVYGCGCGAGGEGNLAIALGLGGLVGAFVLRRRPRR